MLPHGRPFPPPPAVGSRLVLIAIQTLGDRISFYLKDEFTGLVWIVEARGWYLWLRAPSRGGNHSNNDSDSNP